MLLLIQFFLRKKWLFGRGVFLNIFVTSSFVNIILISIYYTILPIPIKIIPTLENKLLNTPSMRKNLLNLYTYLFDSNLIFLAKKFIKLIRPNIISREVRKVPVKINIKDNFIIKSSR